MTSNLIARVLPYLPGTLVEGSAIDIAQNGTAYTISWDSTEAGFSTFGLALGATANAAAAQALLPAPPLSWRNIIGANGGFEVWQRGAGGSASFAIGASSAAYTADRWYLNTQANEASVVSQVAGIVTGSRFAAKIQRNAAQTGIPQITFGFPLESDECAMIAGQVVALSFTAKAGANWSPTSGILGIFLCAGTGTPIKFTAGYTGQTFPIQSTAALTTSAQRFTFVSIVVPANTTQAEVTFTMIPVGTAGADDSFTIDDVQLEVGTFASAFERVPFEKSLLACKRHFWKTFLYGTAPVQNAGVGTGEAMAISGKAGITALAAIVPVRHPVSMRTAPTITTFNPASANAQVREESGTAADLTATAATNLTTEGVTITATGVGTTAVGSQIGVHLTADAGI